MEKRVVLITGGGSGIGKACAARFHENGDEVFILGRDAEKLESARREILGAGDGASPDEADQAATDRAATGQAATDRAATDQDETSGISLIVADVSKVSDCERAVGEVLRKAGRLDVLVNSAGVSHACPSVNVTEEIWDRILDTNLKGTFFMIRSAIPALEKTGGCVVNLSSDAGVAGNSELAAYCASKGGVTVMTKSLALELAPKGIRVNAVCPTETDTPMLEQDALEYGYASREEYERMLPDIYPQGESARFVRPEEVAESVFFLADNRRAGAITGTALMVDFGITAGR